MSVSEATPDAGSLSITVLGCSGSYAEAGNACSGYLVSGGGRQVWLDAGPGTLANIQQHVDLLDLDALVLSHEHPDHWLEVPVLRNALRYLLDIDGLSVFSTAGTLALAEPLIGELEPTFHWTVIDETSNLSIGEQQWRFSRTDHPVETLACRIDVGETTIAYTADTGPGWSLSSLGDGIDLAVVEASLDNVEAGSVLHLTGEQAGLQAAQAGVARLLLTHLQPGSDPRQRIEAAQRAFDGPVELARVHERYTA